jgi:hypothetical protein
LTAYAGTSFFVSPYVKDANWWFGFGPICDAVLLGILQTPRRTRTKRQSLIVR